MNITFCGHREIHDRKAVKQWLVIVCDRLIAQGADCFYLGGYGAFDHLAVEVLQEKKTQGVKIKLFLILPYLNSRRFADDYDETIYPPLESVPPRYAIKRHNRWMVEQADAVVAYVIHDWGGAAEMLKYARKKQKVTWCFEPSLPFDSIG